MPDDASPNCARAVTAGTTPERPGQDAPRVSLAPIARERVRAEEVLALQSAGRFSEALVAVEAALKACSPDELAALLAAKSVVLVATGDTRDALAIATAAREAARLSGSQPAMADAGLSFALVLQTLDEHRHAIDIASDCDQIGRDCGDESIRLRAQRQLANSYSALGRHQQAITMLEDVIVRLDVYDKRAESLQVHYARMNLLRAQSRRLADSTDDSGARRQAFLEMYQRWHAFAEAMHARGLIRLQAIALGYACRAAGELGDDAFALSSLEASLPLQYSVGLRRSCADAECQHGIVLHRLGRHVEARDALRRAISLMEGSGGPRPLVLAWEALSEVHETLESSAEALHALKQARGFERQLRDSDALVAATLVEQRALIDQLSDEWSKLASEDSLTGVANRRAFDRRLAMAVEVATEDERATAQFALAFLDLDRFKLVNDQCGHGIGDAVLKRFTSLLRSGRRGDDLVARIGGDEFAILFGGISVVQVKDVVQKLVNSARFEDWASIHPSLRLTVSAGVAFSGELPRNERSSAALLRLADERLYAAKRAGRDRLVLTN